MSGTSEGASGGRRREENRPKPGTARTWFPLVALMVTLAVTAALAMNRHESVSESRASDAAAASQTLAVELERSAQIVATEVDRLNELVAAIVAFADETDSPAPVAVNRYLDVSAARDRFIGLRDATIVGAEGTDALSLDPPLLPAADPLDGPVLSMHDSAQGPVTALSFRLAPSGFTSWASLLFDSDEFLAEAVLVEGPVRTSVSLAADAPTSGTYASGDEIVVMADESGLLRSRLTLDVFGAAVQLEGVGDPTLYDPAPYTSVWVILGAGAIAALGLSISLQTLVRSRAAAFATANHATQRLAAVGSRFQASFDRAPIGMAELDEQGNVVAINPALCHQIGRPAEDIIATSLSSHVFEADREAHQLRVETLLAGAEEAAQGEHRFVHDDGTTVWVHESMSSITTGPAGDRSLLVQSQDTTAQRHAAWELAQQALHDDLTGLPNRALFLNRLKHALVRANRSERMVAVMFIDIDRFKVINDSLGHDVGDHLLRNIADRLRKVTRQGDTVARFGGDEFVLLVEGVSGESEAAAAAQRVQHAFSSPFELSATPTYVSASIGITLSSPGDESADALLRDADAAMYRAKEAGRNRTELFDVSMRSKLVARMEIENQLRSALGNGEIVMHYQAIVDPDTHQPAGYEALIRWNHPQRGLLGPGAFLPVAEEAGLIDLIDSFALRAVCTQIAEWVERYPAARQIYLATNWSARHLGRFVQQVEQVIAETGIDPSQLVIEVTEGFLLEDSDASVLALKRLKGLGVGIAIDDFGTGYSSLSYLTQFAVDYLKIDQSFVSQLPESEASAAVIGAIMDLAGRLDIKLVAEGVETDAQLQMLTTMGKPRLQGYRFAKPRPAQDIADHLAARSSDLETIVASADTLLARS